MLSVGFESVNDEGTGHRKPFTCDRPVRSAPSPAARSTDWAKSRASSRGTVRQTAGVPVSPNGLSAVSIPPPSRDAGASAQACIFYGMARPSGSVGATLTASREGRSGR